MQTRRLRRKSGLVNSIGPISSMTIKSASLAALSSALPPTVERSFRFTLYLPTRGPSLPVTDASSPSSSVKRSRIRKPTLWPLILFSVVTQPPTTMPLERRLRMTFAYSVDYPIPGGPVTSQTLLRLAKGEAVFKMRLKAFQTRELAPKDCRGKDDPLRSRRESHEERAANHSLLLQPRGERKQRHHCRDQRGGQRWRDVLRLSRGSGSERRQGGERTLASDECNDGRLQSFCAQGGREERESELPAMRLRQERSQHLPLLQVRTRFEVRLHRRRPLRHTRPVHTGSLRGGG